MSSNLVCALARIDGLQQIAETKCLLRHAVPERLVARGPQQPGVAALGLVVGERDAAVHRVERAGSGLRKVGDGLAGGFSVVDWRWNARPEEPRRDDNCRQRRERRTIARPFSWHDTAGRIHETSLASVYRRLEGLEIFDQRALVVVAESRLLLEIAGAEVVAAIDDVSPDTCSTPVGRDKIGEDFAAPLRRLRPAADDSRSCFICQQQIQNPFLMLQLVCPESSLHPASRGWPAKSTGVPLGIGPSSTPPSPKIQGKKRCPELSRGLRKSGRYPPGTRR